MSEFLRTTCPYCDEHHDEVSPVKSPRDDTPIGGDISLCFQCGRPAIFDFNVAGNLREPTKAERHDIAHHELIQRAQRAWRTDRGRP